MIKHKKIITNPAEFLGIPIDYMHMLCQVGVLQPTGSKKYGYDTFPEYTSEDLISFITLKKLPDNVMCDDENVTDSNTYSRIKDGLNDHHKIVRIVAGHSIEDIIKHNLLWFGIQKNCKYKIRFFTCMIFFSDGSIIATDRLYTGNKETFNTGYYLYKLAIEGGMPEQIAKKPANKSQVLLSSFL